MTLPAKIAGVILAGGSARRMFTGTTGGGDKGLADLAGRPMLAHVAGRLRPQVHRLILNANGAPERFHAFGLDIIADDDVSAPACEGPDPRGHGPLGGVLAAMVWAQDQASVYRAIATVSSDVPFLPLDLVQRLAQASRAAGGRMTTAVSAGQRHPTISLWPVSLADDLRARLSLGERGVDAFAKRHAAIEVDFPMGNIGGRAVDPFFNANTPEDLAEARALLGASPS